MKHCLLPFLPIAAAFAADAPATPKGLEGTIAGAAWTAVACHVDKRMPADDGSVTIDALAEDIDLARKMAKQPYVIISLPTKPGKYPLSRTVTVSVIIPPGTTKPLTEGTVEVTAATADEIQADVHAADVSGTNKVSGHLVAKLK